MAEIGFRAWHIKKKKWFGIFLIDQSGNLYQDGDAFSKDDYIIEQYTGLKDKNGKEIYEGDVVKVSYELNESMSGSVIFRDSGYWLSDKDINYCCWLSSSSLREYEITGNIHE